MTGEYGNYSQIHEYLAQLLRGHWMALPSSTGTLNLSCCARYQHVEAICRARPAGDVSGASIAAGSGGGLDMHDTFFSAPPRSAPRPAVHSVTASARRAIR